MNPAPIPTGFIDTTVVDFGAGSHSGTYVTDTAGGEITLAPTVGAEFGGSSLPAGWESGQWTGGTATVASGRLTVDGAWARTTTSFGPEPIDRVPRHVRRRDVPERRLRPATGRGQRALDPHRHRELDD